MTIRLVKIIAAAMLAAAAMAAAQSYPIVDTGQSKSYNNSNEISAPQPGQSFYGQDSQIQGLQPSYRDNGDGTVTDLNTGLMWQQNLPANKYTYEESVAYAGSCNLAGYSDWRLPTIKEIYSLMLFSGKTAMEAASCIPYIDTDYFDFRFGGEVISSERIIDAQYATSSIYKGTTMGGNETMFGLNLVDGRIKGYPTHKYFEVRLVRGRTDYGVNDYHDNGNGTVTDNATGLMWDQSGSSEGMNWQEALAWAQQKNSENYLGYSDWRLPNAKELHSLVDYDRSPSYTNSAAIDPVFDVPVITAEDGAADYPCYWTSTTHVDGPDAGKAAYVAFGRAMGYMNNQWMDVHGAGAQRSDPKSGSASDYPYGQGPQGDAIRIDNMVRLVRDAGSFSAVEDEAVQPARFSLKQNYPNPFNPSTTIPFELADSGPVTLTMHDSRGRLLATIIDDVMTAGSHSETLEWSQWPSGRYYYCLQQGDQRAVKVCTLIK